MKQTNSFVDTMSLTCVLINIGLFLFAVISEQPQLQLLTLFNVACFSLYFLITGRK
jgi:hypothetical protein